MNFMKNTGKQVENKRAFLFFWLTKLLERDLLNFLLKFRKHRREARHNVRKVDNIFGTVLEQFWNSSRKELSIQTMSGPKYVFTHSV